MVVKPAITSIAFSNLSLVSAVWYVLVVGYREMRSKLVTSHHYDDNEPSLR